MTGSSIDATNHAVSVVDIEANSDEDITLRAKVSKRNVSINEK